MLKLTNKMATYYIGSQVEFESTTGAFTASEGQPLFYGRLPHKALLEAQRDGNSITYTVYSYRTPIAWKVGNVWKFPKVRYSNTTSRHQYYTMEAIKHHEHQVIE